MQPLKLRAKSSQYLSEFAINLFNFHSMPSIAIAGVVVALWVGDVGQGEEMNRSPKGELFVKITCGSNEIVSTSLEATQLQLNNFKYISFGKCRRGI